MEFIEPTEKYIESYYKGCVEMWNHIHDNYMIHNPKDYDIWKNTIIQDFNNYKQGINLPKGFVPSVTYWLISNNEYIGTVNIRLKLNDKLAHYGGHIGVAIRPSKQKGIYGLKTVLWAYNKAKELGISPILATCYKSNKASLRLLKSRFSPYYKTEEDILVVDGVLHEIVRFWFKGN